jgi:3-oxoacyl-ACP reductase-like protein
MGIFDRIRNAIFSRGQTQAQSPSHGQSSGHGAATSNRSTAAASGTSAPAASRPAQAQTQAPAQAARPATQPAPAAQPNAAATAARPMQVDVEAVLERLSAEKGEKLNWRTSIVDLMKLLDLDSSLDNRKELARELGYTGSLADSATMNVWLHKQVMRKLAENGGMVPADLRD